MGNPGVVAFGGSVGNRRGLRMNGSPDVAVLSSKR